MATDLREFTQGVLARQTEALAEAYAAQREEQEQRLLAAKEQMTADEAAAMLRIDEASRQRETRGLQTLDNNQRNQLLLARQEALQGIFDKAYEAMATWDQETFQAFLDRVLERLPQDQSYTLTIGGLTPLPSVLPDYVRLSQETVPNQAGFLLETGGIRYNYWFKALLSDMAPELMACLSQQLAD